MDQKAIRLFLADDHEVVRRGIRNLSKDDRTIEIVGESATAHEDAARILMLRPDVAVLEVRLPDGSGIPAFEARIAADAQWIDLVAKPHGPVCGRSGRSSRSPKLLSARLRSR